MTKRKKCTETEKKQNDIFSKYEEIIKRNREKYGELSKDFRRMKLYAEVAEYFYIAPETAGRIIRLKLRSSK